MSFNVVLNSSNYFGGTTNHERTYAIDWSFMEEGQYDLTFSFHSASAAGPNFINAIELPDLTVFNSYQAADTTTANNSHIIGTTRLFWNAKVTSTMTISASCRASPSDNPPIRCGKPKNSIFTVRLLDDLLAVQSGVVGHYTLILHFQKVKCCDHI